MCRQVMDRYLKNNISLVFLKKIFLRHIGNKHETV